MPIFKTEHLEYFCTNLNLGYAKEAVSKYGRPYESLTEGQKYELLDDALLRFRKLNFPRWENPVFAKFLYDTFPIEKRTTKEIPLNPLHRLGLLFEPQSEQEVVYLFSLFHRQLNFPYVIKFQEVFPDVVVLDSNKETRKIEIEKFASDFVDHGHPAGGCDLIVCWENDMEETPENFPQIISLKDYISEYY